jgi:hypothetical protein
MVLQMEMICKGETGLEQLIFRFPIESISMVIRRTDGPTITGETVALGIGLKGNFPMMERSVSQKSFRINRFMEVYPGTFPAGSDTLSALPGSWLPLSIGT